MCGVMRIVDARLRLIARFAVNDVNRMMCTLYIQSLVSSSKNNLEKKTVWEIYFLFRA